MISSHQERQLREMIIKLEMIIVENRKPLANPCKAVEVYDIPPMGRVMQIVVDDWKEEYADFNRMFSVAGNGFEIAIVQRGSSLDLQTTSPPETIVMGRWRESEKPC